MKNVLYLEVTRDEYELPIAVADTCGELAVMRGTTKNAVLSGISHEKRNGRQSRFKKVVIDDD